MAAPSLVCRSISSLVASYPLKRGQTRLRSITSPWLVAKLSFGAWARVSGVVDAEWKFLESAQEDPTTHCLRSLVEPESVFVDVGANVGYFSLLAAKRGATVVSYEPTPNVFARLSENMALNRLNANLVNAAVMDRAGTISFHLSSDDPEANSLFGDGAEITVPAVSLDDDLKRRGVGRVHLLKIDAEGAEPLVLDGARELLSSPHAPAIVIEVNPFALAPGGYRAEDIYDRLRSHGYSFRAIESWTYNGCPSANVLATREQHS